MRSLPALLSLVGALALAGCGEGGGTAEPDGADTGPSSSASASPTGFPSVPALPSASTTASDVPSSALSELAEQAERQATRAPVLGEAILGADISWPQCPKGMGIPERRSEGMPMPIAAAEYVVIGLTNGPGFTQNPCLDDQVAWVRERGLLAAAYAVVSWPDRSSIAQHRRTGPYDGSARLGALRNTGYQQATYNLATMRAAGLPSPALWVDVEPLTPPFEWSADVRANAAVVQGAARAYTDAGLRIGVYSTPHLWEVVVGDLRLGVPEWRAAGQTSRAEALSRCEPEWSIQGGQAVLAQWVQARRDQNVTCPGIDPTPWFHRF